jgi:hypothetical protein
MKKALQYLLAGVCLVLLPSMAHAQSAISGVVKDASGAVMAGASVTASSDVLIEKSRTAITNGEGRYSIIDLRPGTYVITATLSGFSTVKQTVDVPSNVTVPVDATLSIGSVSETVSVEARVATVDIENAAHPQTLSRQEMDNLPSGRYMQSIGSYVPGAHLNLPDIGGSQQVEQNYISVHGNGSVSDTYMFDGMIINTTYSDGQIQQYVDNAAVQETTYQSSNVTAEASGGGMLTNLVPKDGGNQFHFDLFLAGSGGSAFWEGNNVDQALNNRGLSGQVRTQKIQDFDGALGGPIMKDKLWFMMTGRQQITFAQAGTSVYPNGDPGIEDAHLWNGTFRLTWQANQNNKFSAFYERNYKYKGHEIVGGAFIPYDPSVSAQQRTKWPMYYILQSKWTGTPTSKMVLQAGVSISHLDYNDTYTDGAPQAAGGVYNFTTQTDSGTSRRFVAGSGNSYFQTTRNAFTGNATYVTGNHQIRGGFVYSFGPAHFSSTMNGDGVEVFNNGVPTSFTAYNTPFHNLPNLTGDLGLYITDTWKYKRLSVTAGLRWEYLAADIGKEVAEAGRFAPARSIPQIDCDTVKGMGCWKNWTPRLGVVYDVFGNHKTALKAGFGKFNNQYSTSFTGNFNPMPQAAITETVFWNYGQTLPGGYSPDCAPVKITATFFTPNPKCFAIGGFAPQGTANADVALGRLGASPNPTFGAVASSTGIDLDPNWHRDYNYQYQAGLQQEVYKGVTLNLNWYRRSSYQSVFLVNETSVGSSSWTPFTINNPLDGTPITMYNLSSAIKALPVASLHQTNAPQSYVRNTYTGYEAQVTARLGHGRFLSGGWTMDRQLDRACAENVTLSKTLPDPNSLRYCDTFGDSNLSFQGINVASLGKVSPPWAHAFTLQATSPLKWGFVGSISFLSNQYQGGFTGQTGSGTLNNGYLARTLSITSTASVYPANCVGCAPAPIASINSTTGAATLNCPVASATTAWAPTVGCAIDPFYNTLQGGETINLASPGQVRTDRLNQFDVSLKRTFKFRDKYVIEPTIQFFNVFNTNAIVTQGVAVPAAYAAPGATTAAQATKDGVAPFLDASKCGGISVASCGLGGTASVITNPRLMRFALIFKF